MQHVSAGRVCPIIGDVGPRRPTNNKTHTSLLPLTHTPNLLRKTHNPDSPKLVHSPLSLDFSLLLATPILQLLVWAPFPPPFILSSLAQLTLSRQHAHATLRSTVGQVCQVRKSVLHHVS